MTQSTRPSARRLCPEPGCPTIVERGPCDAHRRTRKARGYGAEHDRLRAEWAPIVATGSVQCWRCGTYIAAGTAWDMGHDDEDRSLYAGPEHVACNRGTAGRAG